MAWKAIALLGLCMSLLAPVCARAGEHETLERVVIVMRHGVRPPTKAKPLPDGYTRQAWPQWPVPPGYLTPHGEQAIARIAAFDRGRYASLLPRSCPSPAQLRVVADTDQRTTRTAQVYVHTLFAHCGVPIAQADPGKADPRFSPYGIGEMPDSVAALAAANTALPGGGLPMLVAANRQRLALLDTVLDCCTPPLCQGSAKCGLADQPSRLEATNGRVKLSGGLAIGASLAQTLLLEYAEGKPMAEVGWGKVSAQDITVLSTLHAVEFALTDRPKAIAAFAARALLREINADLLAPAGPNLTLIVGHDSNLAYLGGALGLHWQAVGFAPDDPSPGGAIVFEKWREADGSRIIRLRYRSQSLDEIRDLTAMAPTDGQSLAFPDCTPGDGCSDARFHSLVESIVGR